MSRAKKFGPPWLTWFIGDAISPGARVLEWVARAGRALAGLAQAAMTGLPRVRHNVRVADRDPALLGHLAGEMFKSQAGIFAVHIPYAGASPAQLELVGGQVDFNFDNLAAAAANIRRGRLRALAVTTVRRSRAMPELSLIHI